MANRYLEFVGQDAASGASSAKFYEVSVSGKSVTVRFGRIGSQGQSKTTTYDSSRDAEVEAGKLVASKLRKGYKEPTESTTPAKKTPAKKTPAKKTPAKKTRRALKGGANGSHAEAPREVTSGLTPFASHVDFLAAVRQAEEAAAAYYDSGDLRMMDVDYDALLRRIEASVEANPEWDAGGLLTRVAAGMSAGGDIPHPTPMLSLAKVTEHAELATFLARVAAHTLVTEVKLDGLAIRAEYVNGALTQVVTRGDGFAGEDVTAQARTAAGLPAQLAKKATLQVRGEVFMTDIDFNTASTNRVAAGKQAFVNPRNATAGTLRNADLAYTAPLSFAAYDVSGEAVDRLPTHAKRMTYLDAIGVTTAISLIPDLNPTDDAATVISAIGERRPLLGFPIDGAVVKVNEVAARDSYGSASGAPKWAVAWKYPADAAQSILRDIDVTIGRTGRMALTAIIDPVFVAGATVSRATLHNVDFVRTQGLGIGSKVAVVRANDVIPRVTALLGEQGDVRVWTPPAACLSCGEPWDTSQALWRCHSAGCSAAAALTYWAARDCMDIERLGGTICEALVDSGLANTVADLYDLGVEDFARLQVGDRLLGEANAREIVAGLERSKVQPLNRVITGLGIRYTGRSVGRWLANEFHSMSNLRAATVNQIAAIDKLGRVKAQHIVDGLATLAPVIDRLAAVGVNMGAEPSAADGESALPLRGKTVVVTGGMTGPLAGLSRNDMNELIERKGGTASGSVSARTSMLVCGEPGSSKYLKAESLGVSIVTPDEFAALIGK